MSERARRIGRNVRALADSGGRLGQIAAHVIEDTFGLSNAAQGVAGLIGESQNIVWDYAAEHARDALRFGVAGAAAVTGLIIPETDQNVRGKKRKRESAGSGALVPHSILFSPTQSTGDTQVLTPAKRLRGRSTGDSPPTLPWYKIQNSLKVDPNASQDWLRWSRSTRSSQSSSQRLLSRGKRHRKHLLWFNTRALLRARRNIKLRKAKAWRSNRAAALLFARRPLPPIHPLGVTRRNRLRIASARKINFRRTLAAKKSLAYAARQYRRLVRSRQRSRRRR